MQCLKTIQEWMGTHQTSKLMRITIYMRMLDWIEGDELPQIDICEEEGGMHAQLALAEQDAIGWDHFFKGQLSTEWQAIQDAEYDRLRHHGEDIPSYKTGIWWTTRLIQLLIYFVLNEWQVHNDHLQEKKEKTAREIRRTHLKEITYQMYEAHQQADHKTLRRYFKRPYLETITKEMARLEHWLMAVISLYEEEAKTEGSLRTILVDDLGGVLIDDLNHTNQAEE